MTIASNYRDSKTMRKTTIFGAAAISMILCGCMTDPIAQYRQQRIQDRLAQSKAQHETVATNQTYSPVETGSQMAAAQINPGREFSLPGQQTNYARASSSTKPPYSGPHNYSTTRGNTYGYTSAETGQVHFFRYDGMRNGRYVLISFEDTTASMVSCEGACKIVRITGYGFDRTYEIKRGSVLSSVVQDMLRGALTPSQ